MEHRISVRKVLFMSLLFGISAYSTSLFAANCQDFNPSGVVFSGCVYGNQGFRGWAEQITPSFKNIQEAINYYKDENLEKYFPGVNFNLPNLNLHGALYLGELGLNTEYLTKRIPFTPINPPILPPILPPVESTSSFHTTGYYISKTLTLSYYNASGNLESKSFTQNVDESGVPLSGDSSESIEDQLKSFAKGSDGAQFLTGLLQARVAKSSIDPVAGTPISYMSRLVDNDFDLAQASHAEDDNKGGLTLFGMSPQYIDTTLAGMEVKTYNLPLRYNHFFNNANDLIIDMPITMQSLNQTQTYSVGLGAAYSHSFLPHWSLMPAFHIGTVGSLDLGSATLIYDGALASRVTYPIGQYELGMTNDVSFLKTQSITIAQYEIAYKLSNWLTKNGVDVNYLFNQGYSVGTYYSRMDVMSGNRWYVNDYNEIGIKSAKIRVYNGSSYNFLTAGIGYLFGPQNFSGVDLSLGVNF